MNFSFQRFMILLGKFELLAEEKYIATIQKFYQNKISKVLNEKKLRGLKRRWKLMLKNLDNMAEIIDSTDDEIFIKESFRYFNRKISSSYKIELFDKLLRVLTTKQEQDDKRCYLLWYLPNDIFESSILIFNGSIALEKFIQERSSSAIDSDEYRLFLNKENNPEHYISARVKDEEMLSAIVTIKDEEYVYKVPVILIANEKIISMVKKELN